MRRLAADLDADPMSPYSYITGLTLIAAYSIGDACRAPVMGSG
ncbi:hypothetical protein [Actinoallomurus iriomotensis]|nr:hypothetical protein [Actinoallomurus iriomotensis]